MSYPKLIITMGLVGLLAALPSSAAAQHRGGGGGGGGARGGGGGGGSARAVPRAVAPGPVRGGSAGTLASRPVGPYYERYPYYSYGHYPYYGYRYPYYGYGYRYPYYPYYGYPGFSFGFSFGYPYYGGYYGYPYAYPAYPPGYVTAAPSHPYGAVKLELPPGEAELYVDGYYFGMVNGADGGTPPINLEAGPHKLEIRPRGGEPVGFDVNIEPGRTITYRAAMPPPRQ